AFQFFFFPSRRRHTRSKRDWSSDVCSSDLLIVSKGDAKEVLGFQQPEGDLPAINLMQLLDNSNDRSGFFQPLVLGEVQEHFINNRSFILPYFTVDDQLKWSSGAVYQGP